MKPTPMKPGEVAEAILRETGNPAVMWGDCGLLDLIADRMGLVRNPDKWMGGISDRHERVLAALSRNPGKLIAGSTLCGKRRVRIFWLEENAPAYVLERIRKARKASDL